MRAIWCLTFLAYTACVTLLSLALEDETVIGIDLGTTYSCVAIYQGSRVDIIANDQGSRVTPSWVGFIDNERLIGDPAKHVFHTIPSQIIFDAKRLIGRDFEDPQLQEDIRHWPFKVINHHGRPAVEVLVRGWPKIFTPQEISAMVLGKMKETAEVYLGRPVAQAVITVPAYFNDEQRQATKDAGQIAGLNVLRIINEPTAAAIAYGLDKQRERESKIIVYDLGGGTFDVSLLRVYNGVFEVLATAGDTRLGGEDFDNRLIDHFAAQYRKETGRNILKNGRTLAKLKTEVEKAKRTLSSQLTTRLEIESFDDGRDFSAILTRAKFEELNLDLFKRTLVPIFKILRDTGHMPRDVDDVVLVGGSTRIPMVRRLLKDLFGGLEPRMGINPDEAVAYGAAVQGSLFAKLTPFDILLTDVCPFTLGIQTIGGVFNELIPQYTPIPAQKSEIFSTATDNQNTVLIQVLQRDSVAAKNILLGTFKLTGIPLSARGIPQIKVTFEIDVNGILTVTAHDEDSGNQESARITSERNQLTKSDIDRMSKEAHEFALSDQEARERSSALNKLQETLAAKRAQLLSDEQNVDLTTRLLLDHYSHWADTLGGMANVSELNSRIEAVAQLHSAHESVRPKSDASPLSLDLVSTLDATSSLSPDVTHVESTNSVSATLSATLVRGVGILASVLVLAYTQFDMSSPYNVLWKLSGHQDRLLTYLSFSPSGRRLVVGSEDQNLLLVNAESGDVLVNLTFEEQTSVYCGLWYSDDNIVVGCCNGCMYSVCFRPTNEGYSATMTPFLHRMTDPVRSLAFDPARHLFGVAHGNTVTLYTQYNPGRYYLPSNWEILDVIQAPSSDIGGLVHGMFFYPTKKGTPDLFVAYAELGWTIWSDVATMTRVSPDTSHNVCRVGRASLADDQKSVVVSTLDHSIAIYALGSNGPNLSSLKEYPYQDVEDLSLVVPVASTSDGITLGGTTHGNVPMIRGSAHGEMSLIRHEEADHLIRVIATHGKKVVVGSSSRSGSVLKCYTSSSCITIHNKDNEETLSVVPVTATEALFGWHELDGQWRRAPQRSQMLQWLKPGRRACVWIILLVVFLVVFLVLALSADPPDGSSFKDAEKQSYATDIIKPDRERHEYWVEFGVRHFRKFMTFQLKMWVLWMLDATGVFLTNAGQLVKKSGRHIALGTAKWMCLQVRVYRESGVCPKLGY
ncbi:ATPase with role in protein import into the ER [Ceratobasidium sp. 428]|nr:ATPase with role in protein import into the ER [Ceratobasidium sp. 428]